MADVKKLNNMFLVNAPAGSGKTTYIENTIINLLAQYPNRRILSITYTNRAKEELNSNAQIGDATNEDFLSSLGVGNFDVCIVAIGDNFQNSLEVTSLLKELGARIVVARAARDVHAKFLLRNGADEIVYPERQLADWVAIRYSADHILDYIELDEGHAIFEISIPGEWIGKTIGQLDIRKKYNINIMALKTNDIMNLKISSDTQLLKGSTMLVLGETKHIQKCFHI